MHGIGLPNTREWTRHSSGMASWMSPYPPSGHAQHDDVGGLYGRDPLAGYRPSYALRAVALVHWCVLLLVSTATASPSLVGVSVRSAMPHGSCPRRGHVHGGVHRCIASCYRGTIQTTCSYTCLWCTRYLMPLSLHAHHGVRHGYPLPGSGRCILDVLTVAYTISCIAVGVLLHVYAVPHSFGVGVRIGWMHTPP